MKERPSRKLAVILHADVVGSTRLVQLDEALAHNRIQDAFQRFANVIESYHGHALELRGDALVAEFDRASDALDASLAFQAENSHVNADIEDEIRPILRVGIGLGEVVVADNTISGEGVVLAQRLEQLASPGGICIQGAVYEAVPGRLPFEYQSLGEQTLKGFSEPVRAYAVTLKSGSAIPPPEAHSTRTTPRNKRPRNRSIAVGALSLIVVLGGGLAWLMPWKPEEPLSCIESLALELPDRPTLAVLPFENLTGDAEQEYFSDGITVRLITALANIPELFVIARDSALAYKDKALPVQQVAEELGVRYVLEGSVQRSGNTVRISTQLVDASGGQHLWAETYDRDFDDIFALQDDIAWHVATEMDVKLAEGEQARLWRDSTDNPKAYDLYLRALDAFYQFTPEGIQQASELLQPALELDPEFTAGWVLLGWTYHLAADAGVNSAALQEKAIDSFERAVELDPTYGNAYTLRGSIYISYDGDLAQTIAMMEKAVALNPNDSISLVQLARQLPKAGKVDEAWELVRKAARLDPNPPPWYFEGFARASLFAGRCEEAIACYRECLRRIPEGLGCHIDLMVSYMAAGREEEGKAQAQEVLRLNPNFSVSTWGSATKPDPEFMEAILKANAVPDPHAGQCVVDRIRRAMFALKAGIPE